MPTVVLDSDLGERYGNWSLGDDEALLSIVTSANVACAVTGNPLTLRPDSICVHGDTEGAVGITRSVHGALRQANVNVAPFALS